MQNGMRRGRTAGRKLPMVENWLMFQTCPQNNSSSIWLKEEDWSNIKRMVEDCGSWVTRHCRLIKQNIRGKPQKKRAIWSERPVISELVQRIINMGKGIPLQQSMFVSTEKFNVMTIGPISLTPRDATNTSATSSLGLMQENPASPVTSTTVSWPRCQTKARTPSSVCWPPARSGWGDTCTLDRSRWSSSGVMAQPMENIILLILLAIRPWMMSKHG